MSTTEHRLVRADFKDPTETWIFVRHPELVRGTEVWLVQARDRPLGWRVESSWRKGEPIHRFDWPHYVRTLPESLRGEAVAQEALQELGLAGATWDALLAAVGENGK